MGTAPKLNVESATLAGGTSNQDRYGYGDNWAFVLDGASSFAPTRTHQDGGWYAEQLRLALTLGLERSSTGMANIVEVAIEEAAGHFSGPAAACPSSTVAIIRLNANHLETYVLGDSSIVLITKNNMERDITDNRIDSVGGRIRSSYRERLKSGGGFDARHRDLLISLQKEQAAVRNRPQGYWIASNDPGAAYEAIQNSWPIEEISQVLLATDGAASIFHTGTVECWSAIAQNPVQVLRQQHLLESEDSNGAQMPRSKLHDDKTLLVASWTH